MPILVALMVAGLVMAFRWTAWMLASLIAENAEALRPLDAKQIQPIHVKRRNLVIMLRNSYWFGFLAALPASFWFGSALPEFATSEDVAWYFHALRILTALFAMEVASYVYHRAAHRYDFLWKFHRYHHQPRTLHWTDGFREHFADFFFRGSAMTIAAIPFALSIGDVLAIGVFLVIYTAFLHANVKISYGKLERVFASPRFHRQHHDRDIKNGYSNFATLLSFLDVIFETMSQSKEWPKKYGFSLPRGKLEQKPEKSTEAA